MAYVIYKMDGVNQCIAKDIGTKEGMFIPFDEKNADYQDYLKYRDNNKEVVIATRDKLSS